MEFELFSKLHLLYLLGYSFIFILLYFGVATSHQPKKSMKIISLVILAIKCGELFIRYKIIGEAWYSLLPFHLCNITLIFAIFGSIFRFQPLLQATFFWAIGALFAILTPEVRDTFPSFFNISFFSTHFYILFTAIVEYKVFKLRPNPGTWLGSLLTLNGIAVGVYFINSILGTNYLYISQKPTFNSPLNYLGPWPYYIISVEIIYMILTLGLLFLFKKKDYKVKLNR